MELWVPGCIHISINRACNIKQRSRKKGSMVLGLLCQSGKLVYYYLDKTLRIGKKNQTLKIVFNKNP